MIAYQESIDLLMYSVLIVNILRIIQCTSLHPRLASLTGTLSEAMDDLWHTALHTFLVLGLFAAVGTWRFGSTRNEFSTISASFATELGMLFSGGFIENWDESLDLQVFLLLFLTILIFLVLNFLLANIVNAFTKIQKHNEELDIEQNFVSDVGWTLVSRVHQHFQKWPGSKELASNLNRMKAKFSITFYHLEATKLFPSDDSIYSFVLYYKEFDFLKPMKITKFGKEPQNSKEQKLYEIKKIHHKLYSKLRYSCFRPMDNRNFSTEGQHGKYICSEADDHENTENIPHSNDSDENQNHQNVGAELEDGGRSQSLSASLLFSSP
jgi:hypothetical protein